MDKKEESKEKQEIETENVNDEAKKELFIYYWTNWKKTEMMEEINKGNVEAMQILGTYYQIEKNYELMKKYYELANNGTSMYNMAKYYGTVEKNIELMKRYYEIAIEKGSVDAMYNLGNYYQYIEKDYEKMKKYYGMAIENGDRDAMYNIGIYYQSVENDYEKMKKYYEESGFVNGIYNLCVYWKKEKNYEMLKKYSDLLKIKRKKDDIFNSKIKEKY